MQDPRICRFSSENGVNPDPVASIHRFVWPTEKKIPSIGHNKGIQPHAPKSTEIQEEKRFNNMKWQYETKFPRNHNKEIGTATITSPGKDQREDCCGRGVARNFVKMKPANRISEISAEAQHFLQGYMCAQRSSKESLAVWLISEKQWLWSACAFAQADLSHCLAGKMSCRKCCGPAHLMPSEQV